MKIRYLIIYIAIFLIAACGNVKSPQPDDGSGGNTSAEKKAAELIATRHARSMLKAYEAGNFEKASEDLNMVKTLLNTDNNQLPVYLKVLLPEQDVGELQKIVKACLDFKATPLVADDSDVKDSLTPEDGEVDDGVPVAGNDKKIELEIKKILVEFGESQDFKVPPYFFRSVKKWIVIFTRPDRHREWYERSLNRMNKYYPMISNIFSEKRLPQSLYYLALVESGFNPYARSRAGAVGLWQFMRATGRRYGLRVNRRVDQRKNPKLATRAAREYLLDLILEFGDGHGMLLAMAAYNAGENRIRSRLRRLDDYRNRSFWSLSEKNLLPKETREYVPKIIAAAVIAKNRRDFGFNDQKMPVQYAAITLGKPVSVPLLAQLSGMRHRDFLKINPDLDADQLVTPKDSEIVINVPKAKVEAVKSHHLIKVALTSEIPDAPIEKMAEAELEKLEDGQPKDEEDKNDVHYLVYNVKRGNNVSDIARWFKTTVGTIKRDNPYLRKRKLRPGDKIYIHKIPKTLKTHFYTVNRGDSFSEIGDLYGVHPSDIRSWNGARRLREGRQLVVYTGAGIKPWKKVKRKVKSTAKRRIVYKVKYRNTLKSISSAFRVSVRRLKQTNKLRSSRLRIGQRLVIPRSARKIVYRVRRGDNLQRIARRYRSSIRSIKTFNGLRTSRIIVGEYLIIYRLT